MPSTFRTLWTPRAHAGFNTRLKNTDVTELATHAGGRLLAFLKDDLVRIRPSVAQRPACLGAWGHPPVLPRWRIKKGN